MEKIIECIVDLKGHSHDFGQNLFFRLKCLHINKNLAYNSTIDTLMFVDH